MGDYADMMLDGTCCESCGEFIGEPTGHPRYCSLACEPAISLRRALREPAPRRLPKRHERDQMARHLAKQYECPTCGKRLRFASALSQHIAAKHAALSQSERGKA